MLPPLRRIYRCQPARESQKMNQEKRDVRWPQQSVCRVIAAIGLFATAVIATASTNPGKRQIDERTASALASAGIPFVANRGQWSDDVAFAAMTFAGTLAVGSDGRMHYRLQGSRGPAAGGRRGAHRVLTESFVDTSN